MASAAVRAHADAVHPGHGFLAENADFAQAVIDAGMVWVGPKPETIRVLGSKVAARRIAAEVVEFAREHGLPIAIKAVYGGGGRGLKVVHEPDEVAAAFESAMHEAEVAFGNGDCFVERFLTAMACGGAGARRPVRHRARRGHARLLAAAAQPEAHRGGARTVPGCRDRAGARARRGGDLLTRALRKRGNGGVPRRRRHDELHGGQYAHPGGTPRHRGGHRRRSRGRPTRHCRGRAGGGGARA